MQATRPGDWKTVDRIVGCAISSWHRMRNNNNAYLKTLRFTVLSTELGDLGKDDNERYFKSQFF